MSSDEDGSEDGGMEVETNSSDNAGANGEESGGGGGGGGRKRRASRGTVSYKETPDDEGDDEDDDEEKAVVEEDDDDDDDDDIPLASLKIPSPAKKKKASAIKKTTSTNGSKVKAKAKATSPASSKKKKAASSSSKSINATTSTNTTSSSSSSTDYASPSFALYGSESKKGQLIQKLLCRWWYAITWPDPSKLPEKPPTNYDAMDGFPGVYVCTAGEDVGTIKDMRDKSKAPNFNNFAKMTSKELCSLLVKALQEQKRQLIAAEGSGTETEKELNTMIKWAEKLNTNTADKEAEKVLKAAKLSLPE